MTLVSITPGEPSAVRVYACAKGSRLRVRVASVKFNRTPNLWEVSDLRKRPQAFIDAADVA